MEEEKWRKEKGTGQTFEVVIAEDLPKSIRDMKAHSQEALNTSSRINNKTKTKTKSALNISYSKCRKSRERKFNRSRGNQKCERNSFHYFPVCASAT